VNFKRKMARNAQRVPGPASKALEERCHGIAQMVRAQLPPNVGFILLTIDAGAKGAVSYMSTLRRDDAARAMTELVDSWIQDGSGNVAEPTVETMTQLREAVYAARNMPFADVLKGCLNEVEAMATLTRTGELSVMEIAGRTGGHALALAVHALNIFTHARDGAVNAPAPPDEAKQVAEELLRHYSADPNRPSGDTKTTLVADLERKTPSRLRDVLIEKCKAGEFHDYDSPHAAPKVMLDAALRELGYEDLAENVRAGHYDAERPTVEQIEEMRVELGPETYDRFMGEHSKRGRGSA
jgi:hypothetical protein